MKIVKKFRNKRKKDVKYFKDMIDPKRPYNKKKNNLEYAIENTFMYFDNKKNYLIKTRQESTFIK